jgi:pyridoxamine 5'-phosphate oxidase
VSHPNFAAVTDRDLDLTLERRIWQELQRATQDRHHEWRTPVVASVDASGAPQARTVVLRHADATTRQLTFYTDTRSPKAEQLRSHTNMAFVFWSKRLNWQLRVRSSATVVSEGAAIDAIWNKLRQSPAAGDYLSATVPGSPLHAAAEQSQQQGQPDHEPTHHLAVVIADVIDIDWLELARTGHRRARLVAGAIEWCVP